MPPDPPNLLICSVFLTLAAAGPLQCERLEPPVIKRNGMTNFTGFMIYPKSIWKWFVMVAMAVGVEICVELMDLWDRISLLRLDYFVGHNDLSLGLRCSHSMNCFNGDIKSSLSQLISSYMQIKMQAAIDSTVEERQKLAHLFLPGVVMYLHETTTKR